MKPPNDQTTLERQVLNLLGAHLHGMSSPRLRAALKRRISQPTLSRLLTLLRSRGLVARTGAARATRYHLVGGSIGKAELHSRLLHEQVAKKLVRDPALKAQALERLEFLKKANPSGRIYHERWAELMDSDMPTLLRAMTEDSERAATLRRESPFTLLYDPGLRRRLLQGNEPQAMQQRLKFSSEALARLCREHRVRRLSLFGSAVRADFRPDSDVDVLVEFAPHETPALGEMADMREELSALFGGRKVDLATPAILRNPYRRKAIERDLETVYAAE